MKKKTIIAIVAIVFVLSLATVIKIKATTGDNKTMGWLWGGSDDGAGSNANIGWISMNNANPEAAGAVPYDVTIPQVDGDLSGYVWSENIGWISFSAADLAGCPNGTCSARRVGTALQGWARIMSIPQAGANAGGWQGWISLSGTAQDSSAYGVNVSGAAVSGYAFSDELGYVNFGTSNLTAAGGTGGGAQVILPPLPPAIILSSNPLSINVETNPLPQNVTLTWSVVGATSCTKSGGAWSGVVASPTNGVDTISQNSVSEIYTLSCTGPGGPASQTVTVSTMCNDKACSSQLCATTPKFGVPDGSSCTQSCSVDSDCTNFGGSVGTWTEVAP